MQPILAEDRGMADHMSVLEEAATAKMEPAMAGAGEEAIEIPIPGEAEEMAPAAGGETEIAEPLAKTVPAAPGETKRMAPPDEKELAAEGIAVPMGAGEREEAPSAATARIEPKEEMAAESLAAIWTHPEMEAGERKSFAGQPGAAADQDLVETEAFGPASAGPSPKAPLETARADEWAVKTEMAAAAPMETALAGEPSAAPMETVAAGPKETISAEGPKETAAAQPVGIFAAEDAQAADALTDVSQAADDVPADWSPGQVILDLYEVTRLLGEGGMGKVYQVHHRGWNIDLAVKSPKPSELAKAGAVETFETEAETWVNLGLHPNTVSCYYVRRLGGIPRVFAEYVDGGSMQDWIREGKLSNLGEMLDVAIQFAWGLDYAHERGLVHQDIKPANVMMTKNGVAKVTDFGLAKVKSASSHAAGGADGGGLVAFGGMTPAYCSPEQADRAGLSRKTDVWSWALSILEMFVGETTWMFGVAANEALNAYLADGPVNKTLPKAPEALVYLLRRCFNYDPSQRPESMMDVAEALMDIYQKTTGQAYPRKVPKAGRATADSLNNRAVSFLDLGEVEEASSLWREALVNEPHHPQATYNFGLVNWRGGKIPDLDVAMAVEESVKSHGADSDCEYYLGLVHLERDDCQAALEALRSVLKTSHIFTPAMEAGKDALERLETSRRLAGRMTGHAGSVNCIALAGDGKRLFSSGDDHSVIQWDSSTGAQDLALKPDKYPAARVAVTFDGGLFFTAGYKTARMFATPSGQLLREINAHDGWINALEVSDDSTKVLTAGGDGCARVWSLETGERLLEVRGSMGAATMSGDGRFILFGAEDGTVKMVTGGSGALVRSFDVPPGAMALSRDGRLAALAALDNSIHVYDARTGVLHRKMTGHRAAVSAVAVNQEGTLALSGGYDRTVRLWDMYSGRCLRTFKGHGDTVNCLVFSGGSKYGVSCAQDGAIIRWSLATPKPFRAPLMVSRVQASEIVLSAGAAYEEKIERVKEALEKGDVKAALAGVKEAREQHGFSRGAEALEALGALYSRLPRKTLSGVWESKTVGGHTGAVSCVAISWDCSIAISAGADRVARVWDLSTFREKKILEGHNARVNHVAISGDSAIAVTAGGEGAIKVWDLKTGAAVDLDGHKGAVNKVAITWDKKFVVSGGADRTVKIWDVKSRRIIRSLRAHQGEITSLDVSEFGLILSGSEDRTARLWDMVSGKTIRTFDGHEGTVCGAKMSPDLSRVYTAGKDGRLIGWDLRNSDVLFTAEGLGAPFTSLALSTDGKFLATSREERGARFWNAATGESVRTFMGHSSTVNEVALSADGRLAITCGDDKWIRVWTLDWELEPMENAMWSDGAAPWARLFLAQRTPRAAELPEGREPFEKEIFQALSLAGRPVLKGTLEDCYTILGHAGFGWLDKEGIKNHLQEVSTSWKGPDLDMTLAPQQSAENEDIAVGERIIMKEDPAPAPAPGLMARLLGLFPHKGKGGR
jgi:WD40 repeat protein/serine/threonine protein kinase